MDIYGEEGYLYVMLCARYLSAHGRKILVVDESESRKIVSLLPLPPEQIDCLYYQGVDYVITGGLPAGAYDAAIHFYGRKENEGRRGNYPAVVFTDLGKESLRYALDFVLAREAVLVAVGVPKCGTLKSLLDKKKVEFMKCPFLEIPWRCRDAKILLAFEHGIWVSPHRLSGAMTQLLRLLSRLVEKEVEACDCSFLEQCE